MRKKTPLIIKHLQNNASSIGVGITILNIIQTWIVWAGILSAFHFSKLWLMQGIYLKNLHSHVWKFLRRETSKIKKKSNLFRWHSEEWLRYSIPLTETFSIIYLFTFIRWKWKNRFLTILYYIHKSENVSSGTKL